MIRALALLAAATLAVAAVQAAEPLRPVPELDLSRYAGTWHEIARLPMKYEADCVRDITATYTPLENGRIAVRNECTRADGQRKVAEGVARPAGAPAKLQVRFAPAWLSFLPMVWADYWVIALDDEYRWALVGEPGREFLWILSREPSLPAATFEDIKSRARAMGYRLDQLIVVVPPA